MLQYKISIDRPTNEAQIELKGKLHEGQGGLSWLSPLRSDSSYDSQARRLDHMSSGQRQLNGGHWAQVHSDQMVLVIVRQGGWPREGLPRDTQSKLNLKGDYQARVRSG
jgi:hypothetical protein